MDKIVVVADLGHFSAYRLSRTPQGTGRLDLIESFDSLEAHGRYSEKVTDQAGKFGAVNGKRLAKGYGEAHNIDIENEKRMIKNIAKTIRKIITDEACDGWHLAAEKAINGKIVEHLDAEVKAKLGKNVAANLTKAEKNEIIGRFL